MWSSKDNVYIPALARPEQHGPPTVDLLGYDEELDTALVLVRYPGDLVLNFMRVKYSALPKLEPTRPINLYTRMSVVPQDPKDHGQVRAAGER